MASIEVKKSDQGDRYDFQVTVKEREERVITG